MAEEVPYPAPEDYNAACLLVGRFMYHWALLEGSINDGIGKLLGLGDLEEAIATNNMQFRSKVHILKTLVNLKGGKDWAKAALKDIEEISDLSAHRNIVAHTVFGPDNNQKAVRFLAVKAKGKLTFPNTVWTVPDFNARCKRIAELRKRVDQIVFDLTEKPGLLAHALREYTNQSPAEQGFLGPLSRLVLGLPDSEQSTSEIAPETPQEPQAK
ncbi:MAG: hypothetical protein ACTHJK_08220 [Sphingomicrobium sp.]